MNKKGFAWLNIFSLIIGSCILGYQFGSLVGLGIACIAWAIMPIVEEG